MKIRQTAVAALLAAATGGVLAATSAAAVDGEPDVLLSISPGPEGSVVRSVEQHGTAAVVTGVSRTGGGEARTGPTNADGTTVRLPAYEGSSDGPRAILRVVPGGGWWSDPLAPRWSDFSFGADFRKDALSWGSAADNGDNLIQRGLSSDPSQYKVEVERDHVACRVKGSRGSVVTRVWLQVDARAWYHAACKRAGGQLTLSLTESRADAASRTWVSSAAGEIGDVSWWRRETPLSVGGKLTASGGVLESASDQFNGLVDQPFLIID